MGRVNQLGMNNVAIRSCLKLNPSCVKLHCALILESHKLEKSNLSLGYCQGFTNGFVDLYSTGASDRSFCPIFRNITDNTQTQICFVSWVTVRVFSAQSPIQMPRKDLHITPKVSCFSFKFSQSSCNIQNLRSLACV